MRVLLKYIFWLLSFFSLVIYYLLGTTLGHITLGKLLEDHYSEKLGNKVEIRSLNIEKFPYVIIETKINDGAVLWLNGEFNREDMNMTYHLKGETFKWNDYHFLTPIDVTGSVKGKSAELFVQGEGSAFHGEVVYTFINKADYYENVKGGFTDVNATEILRFFDYEELLVGDMNISISFDHFTPYRKKGFAKVSMSKASMPEISGDVAFTLDAKVDFKDLLHEFFADIDSDIGRLRIANGHYNSAAELVKADYGLHINELNYFEAYLGHAYKGELNTAGSLKYESGKLSLKGDSTSYGGLLEYEYRNKYLDLYFKAVSLEKFLRQLSYPPLLSSKIYGSASYDIKDEIILVNTELKETRFRRTRMTDRIYEVTGINILKDVYNDSIFTAGYQDAVLTSLLKIDNGVNHLYLKNTRMNSNTNEITADFEVQIDNEEFFGEIDGTLENPQVHLDMTKIIKYKINKSIDNFFN